MLVFNACFQMERICHCRGSSQRDQGFLPLKLTTARATDLRRHQIKVQALVWTRKLYRSFAHFIACSFHGLQVKEEFRNPNSLLYTT